MLLIVSKSVLTPKIVAAGEVLLQRKIRPISWDKVADAAMENTKLCVPPAGMSTGRSCEPIGKFWASVRW